MRAIITQIVNNPAQYSSNTFDGTHAGAKVNLDMAPDASSLPKIHFEWNEQFNLFCLNEEEAKALTDAGFTLELKDGEKPNAFLQANAVSHVTFCNFRRYGWSWTNSPEGEYGYCSGPVYANDMGAMTFLCMSPEDVVKMTLAQGWAQIVEQEGNTFARIFNTHAVSMLLKELLDDALENLSRFAAPANSRSSYVDHNELTIQVKRPGTLQKFTPEPKNAYSRHTPGLQKVLAERYSAPLVGAL
jgi:hypothetical protein